MHPVLFSIAGFEVHTYGVLAGVGFLFGVTGAAILGSRPGPRGGFSWDFLWDLAIVLIVGAVVGSRLEYVRTRWAQYAASPVEILDLRDGGLVFYGGLIGAVLSALVYIRWRRQSAWRVLDLYAPFIVLGHALGRLGCFAAGCCYGAPTDLPWAVVYPMGGKPPGGVPLHPTQLYEVLANVLIGGVLLAVRARGPRGGATNGDGLTFAALLLLYPAFRSVNELFRGDGIRGAAVGGVAAGGLTNGQAISVALFAIGLVIAWARWPRGSPDPAIAADQPD
ncbi:MAG: prolipoprotein diacylglyceryl transferase [Pseudomonadota bacterium]|nr:prolipoprotein diacylglyceryl transferase [Pseudomonadota bacterium]